jgi:hypothetical protein
MNQLHKKEGADQDLRGFVKAQHKKFYSICRLFANNYKEHQRLFFDIIAAVSHSIRNNRSHHEKQTLLLRACINMSALHSIARSMEPETDRSIQFKSPEYQNSMVRFRESISGSSEYDKILMFLSFQKVSRDEARDLTGVATVKAEPSYPRKNFIPYLKEKLIWS